MDILIVYVRSIPLLTEGHSSAEHSCLVEWRLTGHAPLRDEQRAARHEPLNGLQKASSQTSLPLGQVVGQSPSVTHRAAAAEAT